VVFCGDFFQLPPVDKGNAYCPMAFEAECWDKVIDKCFILKKTFRQTDSGK
jgi:ATP-dependent DNA helicase PIF1